MMHIDFVTIDNLHHQPVNFEYILVLADQHLLDIPELLRNIFVFSLHPLDCQNQHLLYFFEELLDILHFPY